MRKDFGKIPSVRYNRSKFDLSHGVKTTMSVGRLYPLKVVEVLPGDSFKSVMTAVCRCTSAFLKPIVDNLFMDIHHFFVPFRLLYDDSEKVFGNPNPSQYTTDGLAEYPSLPAGLQVTPGSVADYLGLPVAEASASGRKWLRKGCSILPFRAFAKVYNDWFRNENTVDEVLVQRGNLQTSEYLNSSPWSPNNYTGMLPFVSKKKDYFTAGLPATQKGAAVPLPLGTAAPVFTDSSLTPFSSFPSTASLKWYDVNGTNVTGQRYIGLTTLGETAASASGSFTNATSGIFPANLYADLSQATASDVATLRTAFQLQKMLEKDARYGSRYNEFLLGHFGVISPDARLQFSEYLGGGRIPISIQQVSQTSAPFEDSGGDTTSPMGSVAANSQSVGRSRYSKGFVEHGYVITVGCIKQLHTYQQGVPRFFFRKSREDFYDPLLANISEQPVYKAQLFGYDTVTGGTYDQLDLKDGVFNYNEAWADYRYEPNIITGQMRSGISNSLDIWHLGDYYSSAPTFGKAFTDENNANIDRVLAVNTSSQDNFLVDLWFNVSAIRVMPVYSVPGLVDHH